MLRFPVCIAAAAVLLSMVFCRARAANFETAIVLTDHLEHAWATDAVHRTVEIPATPENIADRLELKLDGKIVPMQVDNVRPAPNGKARLADIWFRTDLPANGTRKFVLSAKPGEGAADRVGPGYATDLQISQKGAVMEIANGLTAVRIPGGKWAAPAGMTDPNEIAAALSKDFAASALPGTPAFVAPAGGAPTQACPGPILGVRLASGTWTAASQVTPEPPPADAPGSPANPGNPAPPAAKSQVVRAYETELLASGPIFAKARISYQFVNGGTYVVEVTLRAQDPLVRVDETYSGGGRVTFDFFTGLEPTKFASKIDYHGEMKLTPIAYDKANPLQGMVGWDFYLTDRSSVIGYLGGPREDLLAWMSTSADWLPSPYAQMFSVAAGPGAGGANARSLAATGSLASGHRHWSLMVGKGAEFANTGKDLYLWWNKRLVITLDKVSNWQLVWPDMESIEFPHTFFSAKELPEIRQRLKAEPAIVEYMEDLRKSDSGYWGWSHYQAHFAADPERKALLDKYAAKYRARGGISKSPAYMSAGYLYFGDHVYLEQLADKENPLVERTPAEYVDHFTKCWLDDIGVMADGGMMGNMNVSDAMLVRCLALDLVLGSDLITPAEKRRLLTRLAFMTYVMHDPVWQPPVHMPDGSRPEGYGQGTPNQKHCAFSVRAMTACALTNHPMKKEWMKFAMAELRPHYSYTIAESGALLESPFYSSRDTMRYAPFWSAMIRAGVAEVAPDYKQWLDRPKKAFAYLADMLTPREPRFAGKRVYHPIGRSSTGVIDPTFMIGADPWAAEDPAHGALMRWAWTQQGKPSPDITGATGGRNIALTLLAFSHAYQPLTETPLRSRRYEGMGAVLRSNPQSDFESNIVWRHDPFCWDLYAVNNGAVYFYGKGAPLLPRFGAYWSHSYGGAWMMDLPFGNRLEFASGDNGCGGNTTRFAALNDLADFVEGVTGDKHWRRAVLFAKDLDHDDPVYLLVRDDVHRPDSATSVNWWVMTKNVAPDGPEKPGVVPIKISHADWTARMGRNWAESLLASNGGKQPIDELTGQPAAGSTVPALKGQFHHFPGMTGVDLDLFIAAPADPQILTDAASTGKFPYSANPALFETQQLVRISQPAGKPYLTLLAPRFPGAPVPKTRTIADGAGVAVTQPKSEDRLFLAPDSGPIKFEDDVASFEGQAGFARRGADGSVRLMVLDGKIASGGVTLTASVPAAVLVQGQRVRVVHQGERAKVKLDLPANLRGADVKYEAVK